MENACNTLPAACHQYIFVINQRTFDDAWVDGVGRVGRYAASAILATVLEKSLRDVIAKPGGYFRAMVDRAIDGSLHLSKSLYGLAESKMNTRDRWAKR